MDCWELRFIPAYAGNSNELAYPNNQPSVHPRLRGELRHAGASASNATGSSPLTRGTLKRIEQQVFDERFIPAYAGNSKTNSQLRKMTPVHPRLRGELSRPMPVYSVPGRFIPAYAGNSADLELGEFQIPVHPRLRGELT